MTGPEQPASNRTRNRRLLWSGLALSLLLIVGGGMVWLAMPGPMERASKQIKEGMTVKEVEDIIGQNPESEHDDLFTEHGFDLLVWHGDDGKLLVFFREKLAIEPPGFLPNEKPSYLQRFRTRLRSWLGW
jgi:hypothetical protein